MKKQIITIIFGILLLVNISALYGGESFILDIEEDYEYYSIVGNISEVVLDIQQNGTILTITPDKYSVNDNYEIVFFNKEKETIYVSTGGGGSRTKYIQNNITEYKNNTEYIDKIIEKEIKTPVEKIIEKIPTGNLPSKIIIIFLVIIIILLLLYTFNKSKDNSLEEYSYRFSNDTQNITEKEVNKNE